MGIDLSTLPPHILALNPHLKGGLPVLGQIEKPAVPEHDDFKEPENAYQGPEKHLSRDLITDLRRRGCHVIVCRTDAPATITPGLPDIHAMFTKDGVCRAAAIELKAAGGTVKAIQRECIAEMRDKGIPVIVAWNLPDAINFCRRELGC
jgi:hypothetical protein